MPDTEQVDMVRATLAPGGSCLGRRVIPKSERQAPFRLASGLAHVPSGAKRLSPGPATAPPAPLPPPAASGLCEVWTQHLSERRRRRGWLPAGALAKFLNFLMWNCFTATGWPWYRAR